MKRIPAVYGLETLELPDGYTPLEAVTIVKALDEEGQVSLLIRHTDGLSGWEALGMLASALATQQADAVNSFEREGDDDEDDE